MEKSHLKSPEWWTSLLGNIVSLNAGGVAVDLSKLLNLFKDKEVSEYIKKTLEEIYNDPLPIDRDDKNLTLLKIYVTPSAKYRSDKEQNKNDDKTLIEIPNLIESLLESIETSRSPIIIHGQPGHGKTSSVRMLTQAIVAAEQEKSKSERSIVLMYEFKNLGRLDDNEIQVLSRRTPFVKDESFFHGKNTVLILDGLDERQITDGNDQPLEGFIRRLFELSERINKEKNSRLNLILTGRSQFVKDIRRAFTSAYHLFEIKDFSQEQVERWLEKYCETKKIDPPITYQNFTDKHLQDLIHQPILLTVSAMMLADKYGQKLIGDLQGTISRGDIYRTIITWTYQRKWQCHPNCAALPKEEDYRKFLQILAFILFRHGEEKIKISTLIDALKQDNKLYDLEIVKNNSDESIKDICRHLAVSFFFRGLEENAFSFIHKSIKDYLIAEAIFELLKEATEKFKPKKIEKSCDDMAHDIYFILGKSGLSPEDHIPFLKDIIASQKEAAKEMFTPLEAFFKLAQEHVYLIEHGRKRQDDNANPLITEANVLSGLLYMLTNIFHSLSEDEKKEFYADGYLRLFEQKDSFYKFISLLNSELLGFQIRRFDLNSLDLSDAILSGVNLTGAILSDAILSNTVLNDAVLRDAILIRANLRGASLFGTILSIADLFGANLKESRLSMVNFGGAYLGRADLTGVIGLTHEQLKSARIDETTILPDYLKKSEP
jgi:hypothetical protein